ncbi:hypothetical protein [Actinomycetospora straminea]|uniref:Capsular polysaccharide biosynthesis protein n=2 Tax=Actinomycetospora straminea TaxID=663607 RepID=A0ABP9DZJ3_9PSEU
MSPAGEARVGRASLLGRVSIALIMFIIGAAAGAVYYASVPRLFQASSYVAVTPILAQNTELATGFTQAYGRIATDPQVIDVASRASGSSAADLQRRVTAATSPDAPLIEIISTARDAGQSAREANAVAGAFVDFGNSKIADTGVRLSIFGRASAPTDPASAGVVACVAVGAAAGLLLGILALAAGADRYPLPAALRTLTSGSTRRRTADEPAGDPAGAVSDGRADHQHDQRAEAASTFHVEARQRSHAADETTVRDIPVTAEARKPPLGPGTPTPQPRRDRRR